MIKERITIILHQMRKISFHTSQLIDSSATLLCNIYLIITQHMRVHPKYSGPLPPSTQKLWQWHTEGRGGVNTPTKFQSFDKAEPNSQFHGKYILNNLIGIQVSLICKLSGTPD
jgi:hypothetical protein